MTWEERMGARNAARQAEVDAAADEVDERLQRQWRVFVVARDGYMPRVTEAGEFSHGHYAHGNAIVDADGGGVMGCFSVGWVEDLPPRPDVCPVCVDFDVEVWCERL